MSTRAVLASLALILGSASVVFAAEPPPATATGPSKDTGPSKEMREKMAAYHEQLAACLRSDKPMAECHKEAMKHHQEMMGGMSKEGCTMMDKDHTMPGPSGKTDPPK